MTKWIKKDESEILEDGESLIVKTTMIDNQTKADAKLSASDEAYYDGRDRLAGKPMSMSREAYVKRLSERYKVKGAAA